MRADGSTRKEIKIRPGYRPPEDVEVYKNRAAEAWKQRGSDWRGGVPGACLVSDGDDDGDGGGGGGEGEAKSKNAKKRAAKKRAKEREREKEEKEEGKEEGKEGVQQDASAGDGNGAPSPAPSPSFTSAKTKSAVDGMTDEDKAKQAKAIKKKIRQANDLKQKKDSGEALLPEQLEKVLKIVELTRQLEALGVKE